MCVFGDQLERFGEQLRHRNGAIASLVDELRCEAVALRPPETARFFPANVKLLAIPKDVHARTELLQFDSHYQRVDNTIRVTRTVVDKSPGPVCPGDVSRQYSQIGAAIKKDARAQAVYEPR